MQSLTPLTMAKLRLQRPLTRYLKRHLLAETRALVNRLKLSLHLVGRPVHAVLMHLALLLVAEVRCVV